MNEEKRNIQDNPQEREQKSRYRKNAWHHFLTITHHKLVVMGGCFRVGLWKQGLLHDLSKYSWEEFRTGVLYYQGNRSPNAAEKEDFPGPGFTIRAAISIILNTGRMCPEKRITGRSWA